MALIALAAGAALVWRLGPGSPPLPPSARTSQAARLPVIAPAPVAEIVLQINGLDSARLSTGTPVFLTVSLIGNQPDNDLRVGAPGHSWAAGLRFESADSARPLPWRVDPLGPAVTFRFDRDSDDPAAKSQDSAEQSEVAILDPSRIHRVELGIGPDEAGRIPAGTHTIRAFLPLDGGSSRESKLVSNTVTLTMEGAESSGQRPATAEKARLEAAARFCLLAEKWEEAFRFALELAKRPDADTVTFMRLGDALNGLRRDQEALAAYHQALATLPETQDESPDYLIARIEEIQQRLEVAGAGGGQP